MGRYFKAHCHICGKTWMQNWEEPDECPNGCEEGDYPVLIEPEDDDQTDEAADFGGMDEPDSKY